MKLLASLDPKDRRMLLISLSLVALLLIVLGLVTPTEDSGNQVPDSFLTGQHGARAAYLLLEQSGYTIERWQRPLSELTASAGPGTVLILAAPSRYEEEARDAVDKILHQGGTVLATDLYGGSLLPGNSVRQSEEFSFAACEAQPEGLQPLAAPGSILIKPSSGWILRDPTVRADYTCGKDPVVVEYAIGKGKAIWWASSTPLENSFIARNHNLDLLLNSVGPPHGKHIYWDESLHGRIQTPFDYAKGPVWPLLCAGLALLTLLVILSFSRRSGPIRALPQLARTSPIEFLDALGSLYRSTGAATTAMQIAWERFRTQSARLTGQKNQDQSAPEIAAALEKRFGPAAAAMKPDLLAAQQACWNESLKPRHALTLIQTLRRHEETLRTASTRAAS